MNETTSLEFVGTVTWTVTFRDGRYTFVCDPHSGRMQGSFVAGTVSTPPPPPTIPKLVATVGPRATITLRNAAGGVPRGLKPGPHTIVVRDRSTHHNFHLYGYGVNRATTNAFVGTRTCTVRVYRGKTYVYRCDPHRTFMRGTFRAV